MTPHWMADKVEPWPTTRLIPYARNARTHSDEQVAQIAASIVEFGFTNPVLAGSDGVIIAGHGRLRSYPFDARSPNSRCSSSSSQAAASASLLSAIT